VNALRALTVDAIINELTNIVSKLDGIEDERQIETVELTDKLSRATEERNRARRLRDKLRELLA
jgi:hypothetical protein